MNEQLDALKHLSDVHRAQFRERRSIVEWRCFFTTLTFFVLTLFAVYKGDVELAPAASAILALAFLLVAGISIGFLAHVNMAGNKDKELAERAEDGIRDILNGEPCRQQNIEFIRYFVSWRTVRRDGSWGYVWQALAILSLAIVAIILAAAKPENPSAEQAESTVPVKAA
ncbi:hypothetical protein HQ590_09345, partial [bacterium]|nr:hypothetical protein [bacterium]